MTFNQFLLCSLAFFLFVLSSSDAHFRIKNWLTDENVSVRVTKGYLTLNSKDAQNITQTSDALIVLPDAEVFLLKDPNTEVAIKVLRVTADGEVPVLTYECTKFEEDEEKCEKNLLDDKYNRDAVQPRVNPPVFVETIEKN